jgi:hypothetical protein
MSMGVDTKFYPRVRVWFNILPAGSGGAWYKNKRGAKLIFAMSDPDEKSNRHAIQPLRIYGH